MVTLVVILNILLSLLCLYVAWQVWNLRRVLAATADAVTLEERNTYNVLHGAPNAIYNGQMGVEGLRERYQQLDRQVQQLQQVLTLLGLVRSIWQTTSRRSAMRERSKRLQRSQFQRRRQL